MSFRKRLTVALVVFGAVFLLVPTLLFYRQVEVTLFQNLDDALRSVARAEVASAFDDPNEGPHVHDSSLPAVDSELEQIAWIVDSAGEIVARTANLETEQIARTMTMLEGLELQRGELFFNGEVNGEAYRLLVIELSHRDQRYLEILGLSREPLLAGLASLRRELVLIFLVSLPFLVLTARVLSRSLTAPLTRLSQQLEKLAVGSESARLPDNEPMDRELDVFRQSVNSLLQRVERLLESQKLFVSDASHEIRAPLTNLRVALEVCLRKERESVEYREVLEVCRAEVERLGGLAERLLTLSRLDSEQLKLETRTVDLQELIREAIDPARVRISQLELSLSTSLIENSTVSCDPQAIRQVLDNLIDNALRYAPRGTEVKLDLRDEGEWLRFSISNIAQLTQEQASKVFERFYRGDTSRQRETGGAGLGLAIAAGFVEAHGGSFGVELESPEVKFWFRIPRRKAEDNL